MLEKINELAKLWDCSIIDDVGKLINQLASSGAEIVSLQEMMKHSVKGLTPADQEKRKQNLNFKLNLALADHKELVSFLSDKKKEDHIHICLICS